MSHKHMSFDRDATPKVLQLYLELNQYPILSKRILKRMRSELIERGIINSVDFEDEAQDKAAHTQRLEGITDPLEQESAEVWKERVEKTRDLLTVFYFAHNLSHALFSEIVEDLITQRAPEQEVVLSFNPELAPWDLLFEQGELYESYPPEEFKRVAHHLQEIIVVITKSMISDQLSFVEVARQYFTMKDLESIRRNRIGRGKIGGKSAGMLLAYKILQAVSQEQGLELDQYLSIPVSYYIGADVYDDFKTSNDLFRYMNQKYKSPDEIRDDYPDIRASYLASTMPGYVEERLESLLYEVDGAPLIVRSSSLLEDNFDTSFAGKYDSFFLANQGTPEENLAALIDAIIRVYASVLSPDALIYRQRMGLRNYDERMGILIQRVEGKLHGNYFFPDFAGVAFGHNPYRWTKRIRSEDGLLRLVTGLGTRAVDRVGLDYPRMVALSHPELRPEQNLVMVKHYSQHLMDVLNLESNSFETLHVHSVLPPSYKPMTAIMSVDRGGYLQPLTGLSMGVDIEDMVVTFDKMLTQGPFVEVMRSTLKILEAAYHRPVDMEYAGEIISSHPIPQIRVSILQCRPQARRSAQNPMDMPTNVDDEDILFTANQQVPQGYVDNIRYLVFVDPLAYAQIPDQETRIEIGKVIGHLNQALAEEVFILMGPGRWGSSNLQLGVKVTYTDIYNTRMLIEIAHADGGSIPEVSYGTHFFQDLVEADIYPLPLYPDDDESIYRDDIFYGAPSSLTQLIADSAGFAPYVRVIDLDAVTGGKRLTVVMSSEEERAIAYLTDPRPDTMTTVLHRIDENGTP